MDRKMSVLAIAAAALAVVAGPANAKASASAELSKLSFTLYDLNPDDGIAPGITFDGYSYAYAGVDDYGSSLFPWEYADGSAEFDPVMASASAPHGMSSAEVSGDGTMGGAVARTSGWVVGPGIPGHPNRFDTTAYPTNSNFVLTPWTGIRFDAEAAVSAETTIGTLDEGNTYEYASAYANLTLQTYFDGGYENHTSQRVAGVSYAMTWDDDLGKYIYSGYSDHNDGAFSLSFANLSGDELTGYFGAIAYVYGTSPYAVPEPQTYALMLAGLAVLASLAHRRRGKS